jgi:AcrR family transcriptional regulator
MVTEELTPRQRRAQNTKQAILDAAREIFSERGVYGLSLREVARRIDYSPAGLYEYFGSKDDIILAVLEEGFERFAVYLSAVPMELSPPQYLAELGAAYIRFALQNPQHFFLIFNTPNLARPEKQEDMVASGTHNMLVSAVRRAIDSGDIPSHHREEDVAFGCWSLVHGMATLMITQLDCIDYDWEAASRRVLVTWFQGLQ